MRRGLVFILSGALLLFPSSLNAIADGVSFEPGMEIVALEDPQGDICPTGMAECGEFPNGTVLVESVGNFVLDDINDSNPFELDAGDLADFCGFMNSPGDPCDGDETENFVIEIGRTYQVFDVGPLDYYFDPIWEIKVAVDGQQVWAYIIGPTSLLFDLEGAEPCTSSECEPSSTTPDPLTHSTPTINRNGFSFTPDNYDPTCSYELSSTKGTVLQDPVTGKVTVYGVGSGSSVSVTITDCTGATATVSGTATAPTAPVIATSKPTLSISGTTLLCTAGTSSVTPTSVAYTLYMDGVAVSTKFTDTAIAPSLVPTSADQNSYSGASLASASWTADPAWASKVPSCVTTSLANGAVGIASSN